MLQQVIDQTSQLYLRPQGWEISFQSNIKVLGQDLLVSYEESIPEDYAKITTFLFDSHTFLIETTFPSRNTQKTSCAVGRASFNEKYENAPVPYGNPGLMSFYLTVCEGDYKKQTIRMIMGTDVV